MQLLENEKVIATASKEHLVLTNLRVIQQAKAVGGRFYKSIYLADVTSIAIDKKKVNLLLYLTLITLINGMAAMVGERIVEGVMSKPVESLSLVLGLSSLFFYLLYSFYKISVISIASSSLRIEQQISARDNINDFIYKVEQAKQAARQ